VRRDDHAAAEVKVAHVRCRFSVVGCRLSGDRELTTDN